MYYILCILHSVLHLFIFFLGGGVPFLGASQTLFERSNLRPLSLLPLENPACPRVSGVSSTSSLLHLFGETVLHVKPSMMRIKCCILHVPYCILPIIRICRCIYIYVYIYIYIHTCYNLNVIYYVKLKNTCSMFSIIFYIFHYFYFILSKTYTDVNNITYRILRIAYYLLHMV